MVQTMERLRETGDWGWLKTDISGRIIELSGRFCESFSVKKDEWAGLSVKKLLGIYGKTNKKIIFSTIQGYACLLRVESKEREKVFRVILRQDEADSQELVSFLQCLERREKNKTDRAQTLYSFDDIIAKGKTMEYIKELAARVAPSNSTVLLTGESGTGKELFAQAIHRLSSRKNEPFVAVNCAAIPDELFESEIFGYEGGAFSGARKEGKPGKIELAQNGTLFLDEISELPYQAQGKLLRVLQEKEVERLGGTVTKNIDIRIIAATNCDLRMMVNEGKFRQDLFYRLYVFELRIPSLRERKEDIIPLTYHFIKEFNKKMGKNVARIGHDLKKWLLSHDWPGNVRELRAAIERGMNIVEGDTLTLADVHFSPPVDLSPVSGEQPDAFAPVSLEEAVRRAEIKAIKHALKKAEGDRFVAAQMLKIHISSLYRKIAKYNL